MRLKDAGIDVEFMTLKQVSDVTGLSTMSLTRWFHAGKIPGAQFNDGSRIYIPTSWLESLADKFGWIKKEDANGKDVSAVQPNTDG